MQQDRQRYREAFIKAISIKSRSERTIANYTGHLTRFLFKFNHNIPKATAEQLTDYILSSGSASTMAQVHTSLNLFYTYVLKQPRKVAKYIPYPNMIHSMPVVPTHDQVMMMIKAQTNNKHKLIIRMLYATGMRVSELCNLRWADIQRQKGCNPLSVHITGKGKKDRIVPLSQHTFDLMLEYCAEYGLKCNSRSHYIFGNAKPYSVRSVQNIVRRAGEVVNFDNLSPHDLRRSFGCEQRKTGLDIGRIQELLGHAHITTTRLYTGVDNLEVKMLL